MFSSSSLLNKCKKIWFEKNNIMHRIQEKKHVYYEPKNSAELPEVMKQYAKHCLSDKGAILFNVMRGKISEGIDFSD